MEGVKFFKQKYIDKIQDKDLKIENIRMFCLGKELKDELFLYSYDLVDDMTVQVMFKRSWEKQGDFSKHEWEIGR